MTAHTTEQGAAVVSPLPPMTMDEFSRDGNIWFIGAAVKNAYKRAGRVAEWESNRPAILEHTYDELLRLYASMVTFVDAIEDEDDE